MMRRHAGVCACLCVLVCGVCASAEDYDWQQWGDNGHWYAVVADTGSWETQQAAAEAEGAYLATITSEDEQGFVLGLIQDQEDVEDYYWIGLLQDPGGEEPVGGWHWVTSEALSYTNWNRNEPNNQGDEDFGAIYTRSLPINGKWNDASGTAQLPALFESDDKPGGDPPAVELDAPCPQTLWPPNRKPQAVTVAGRVTDQGGGIGAAWIVVDDEYDECGETRDITDALGDDGSFEILIDLVRWRAGWDRDGREYV
ncbi:MAG: lectin-like protein, partial [Armatimonadota bacterium]